MKQIPVPGSGFARWWEDLWFRATPPEIYAVLRIVFGVLGLACVLEFTPVPMFWAVDGLAPVPGGGLGLRSTILDLGLGTLVGWLFFWLLVIAFSAMAAGYRSQASMAVCFVGTALMPAWNHLPLSSANQVLTSVLFCLMWADCGRVLSVDAWLVSRRRSTEEPFALPIWPLRLIRLQICIIYLNSGLWKFLYPMWRDGAAIHYAISLNIFHRFPFALPPSFHWATTATTYVTLFWEIAFVFLMLHPLTRRLALILGVALHGGMWLTLELGAFSWVMVASYLAFLEPSAFSRRVTRWLARIIRKEPALVATSG